GPQPAPIFPGASANQVRAHEMERPVHSASLRIGSPPWVRPAVCSHPAPDAGFGALPDAALGQALLWARRLRSGQSFSKSRSRVAARMSSSSGCCADLHGLTRLLGERAGRLITEARSPEKGNFR